jgi:glycine C-acetyltransferase
MSRGLDARLATELDGFRRDGVYKTLNHLDSPQSAWVTMEGRGRVLILSSNNYVGLCDVPEVIEAGKTALDRFGAGTGSVRFICGTFTIHRELEAALARFVGTEAALSYVSCWTANEGLMPTVLDEHDVVISDALNHASIIDGVRQSKASRRVYKHSDMAELDTILKESSSARTRFVITDGVFSMEGDIAKLPDILELAKRHDAVVAVDDSHATGVLGTTGRGTAEHFGMLGEIDVITSTLGKALGGAAGGFTAGSAALVDYLVQRSRPQLFSNALPPTVAAARSPRSAISRRIPIASRAPRERALLPLERSRRWGCSRLPGETPIVPIILGETAKAIRASEMMLDEGVFVTGSAIPSCRKGTRACVSDLGGAHEGRPGFRAGRVQEGRGEARADLRTARPNVTRTSWSDSRCSARYASPGRGRRGHARRRRRPCCTEGRTAPGYVVRGSRETSVAPRE